MNDIETALQFDAMCMAFDAARQIGQLVTETEDQYPIIITTKEEN
ncbi:MAG: hypothetical protein WC359_13000 [Dehalococcoidia bacterium]|jgi:hypothetical protein